MHNFPLFQLVLAIFPYYEKMKKLGHFIQFKTFMIFPSNIIWNY